LRSLGLVVLVLVLVQQQRRRCCSPLRRCRSRSRSSIDHLHHLQHPLLHRGAGVLLRQLRCYLVALHKVQPAGQLHRAHVVLVLAGLIEGL
jgi:hypothetical protein